MVIKLRNETEIPILGYTTGLNFRYQLNSRFGFQSRVKYTCKGYQTKKSIANFTDPSDPSVPEYGKFIHHYYFVDIPLIMNYTLGQKKLKFISSLGLVNHIRIKQTNTSVLYFSDKKDLNTTESEFEYGRYTFSTFVSSGIIYKINNKLSARIEPYFMVNTLRIINTPIKGYLYRGGLDVSIWFNL